MQNAPLIELDGIDREFAAGEQTVMALKGVSLALHAGEMVAIVGASGSGKSTLMNILGGLDRPTRGSYRFGGCDVAHLGADAMAGLRREHFGFIFQRYQLLPDLTAEGNVEMPSIYAGEPVSSRRLRAQALLARLGMKERAHHRPGQLSGGQQQRVSIARALMNGGDVILADEPTGALDSRSGEDVLRILQELHQEGHTIVLVTHDMNVARHAQRTIEMADGEVIRDERQVPSQGPAAFVTAPSIDVRRTPDLRPHHARGAAIRARLHEAFRMSLLSMRAHRLRTFLTMLGIVIGVASVVAVVAVGEGSRRRVLAGIDNLGTNTIEIWSGRGWGDTDAQRRVGLRVQDADALAREPYLEGATPVVDATLAARHRGVSANASVSGVNEQYYAIMGLRLTAGSAFDAEAVARRAQDVVIDPNARRTLFPNGEDPIGQVILLGSVPVRVIGVLAPSAALQRWPGGQNLRIYAPHTTVSDRITGTERIGSITVRVKGDASPAAAEHAITRLLALRRGDSDISIQNSDGVRQTVEATSATMTMLIGSIALISLVVGGIGVMNIMLVSVSERTREIGVRMAIGARRSDILQQFMIEAVLVCLIGGLLGIALSFGIGAVFAAFSSSLVFVYSARAIIAALTCASLIGLGFGYLPARNAARLDPVVALARE